MNSQFLRFYTLFVFLVVLWLYVRHEKLIWTSWAILSGQSLTSSITKRFRYLLKFWIEKNCSSFHSPLFTKQIVFFSLCFAFSHQQTQCTKSKQANRRRLRCDYKRHVELPTSDRVVNTVPTRPGWTFVAPDTASPETIQ